MKAQAQVSTASKAAAPTTIWDGAVADLTPTLLDELPWLHKLPVAMEDGSLVLGVHAAELQLVVSAVC